MLGLPRSSYYYEPATETPENLNLMQLMDREHMEHPFHGVKGLTLFVTRETGVAYNEKRIRRLMRLMALEAIYPKPHTSCPGEGHKIYPYLLRDLTIRRPNQVWCSDITYIPMHRGFMYLTVVMDWASRYVLDWQLSNTLSVDFCLHALNAAAESFGTPEIFNTDQGSQFTSQLFQDRIQALGVKPSMDGRGRALDNVIVERLWRSVKYEDVYLHAYDTGSELFEGLDTYFLYYNVRRSHQGLGGATPQEVYFGHDFRL